MSSTPCGSPFFHYNKGTLYCEDLALSELVRAYGSPLYVYSNACLKHTWQLYQHATHNKPVLICYGTKANSNLAILQQFAQWGSGFDIVSGGELARVLKAGGDPQKVVFSGVGKQVWEIEDALKAGIKCFNIESIPELEVVNQVARSLNKVAPISLRVNPDVDAKTHPYISTGLKENKFGIAMPDALATYQQAQQLGHVSIQGLDCHIGSQITELSPYLDAIDRLIVLMGQLRDHGIVLQHLDIGGGIGIRYSNETLIDPAELVNLALNKLANKGFSHVQLILEPGRSLVGNAGVLLTQVLYLKENGDQHFAIVDAGMNDLMRPALYQAYHGILPITPREGTTQDYEVVGPICESGDWLGKHRVLCLEQGDLLAVESAGAYGASMASQYNSRPRVVEVLVSGSHVHVIRPRETLEDVMGLDVML